jgi:hypothetical protein
MAHLGAPLGGVKGGDEAPTPVQRWLDVESFISHRITLDEAWGFELMGAQNGIRSVIEFS